MSSPLQVMSGPSLSNELIIIGPNISNLNVILSKLPLQVAYDDFEEYSRGISLGGLNDAGIWAGYTGSAVGFVYWASVYVDRNGVLGLQASDDMESYTAVSGSSDLNGLNLGTGWLGSYVDKSTPNHYLLSFDTMEDYTGGLSLNGLTSGSGWSSSYVSR